MTREQLLVSDARRYFDAIAGRYERTYALSGSESKARMRAMLRELAPGSRVLELGVGTGRILSSLQDAGHTPVGLDISPNMLERCANRTRPVELVLGDLYAKLPFPDASFDAAVALHGTLAHVPSDEALAVLVAELGRVLARSAVVVIEVPTVRWLDQAQGTAEGVLTRRGDRDASYRDGVTGAAIDLHLYTPDEWGRSFTPHFCVESLDLGGGEIRLVARRG